MTPFMTSDGASLALHRRGAGRQVMFQHGLGGDHLQTREAFPDLPGHELLTLECRAHGASEPAGPFSIRQFAEDVAGAMPGRAVLGGISMGAAIALRIAVTRPELVSALILVRPAWVCAPAPENLASIVEVAELIARGAGAEDFMRSPTHARLAREAPDNNVSLLGFFAREPLDVTARLLRDIASDGPGVTPDDLAALRLPVLICGTEEDVIHPFALAQNLAAQIPGARLVQTPPKGGDRAAHFAAQHAAITEFLNEVPDV